MANRINDTNSLNIGTRVTIGDASDHDVSGHPTVMVLSVYDDTNFFALEADGGVMQYGAHNVSSVMNTVLITPIMNNLTNLV